MTNTGALVLKSGNALSEGVGSIDFLVYKNRVLADGGYIADEAEAKAAFEFAQKNGVNSKNDVGIVSPRWGLKVVDGVVKKLYSLFNSNADFIVTASLPNKLYLSTSNSFNSLTLELTSNNSVKGGDFEAGSSIVVQNINKAVQLGSSAAYVARFFTQFHIVKSEPSTNDFSMLLSRYVVKHPLEQYPTTQWTTNTYIGKKADGTAIEGRQYTAQGFDSHVHYLDSDGLTLYYKGANDTSSQSAAAPDYNGKYHIELVFMQADGVGSKGAASGSDIAEFWAVKDGTKDLAIALSNRSAQKYN